jgi:hypothetical protein
MRVSCVQLCGCTKVAPSVKAAGGAGGGQEGKRAIRPQMGPALSKHATVFSQVCNFRPRTVVEARSHLNEQTQGFSALSIVEVMGVARRALARLDEVVGALTAVADDGIPAAGLEQFATRLSPALNRGHRTLEWLLAFWLPTTA